MEIFTKRATTAMNTSVDSAASSSMMKMRSTL
jgi:hypothetical protein